MIGNYSTGNYARRVASKSEQKATAERQKRTAEERDKRKAEFGGLTAHFTSSSRIVEAASKDTTRPALTHVEVRRKDADNVYLEATDGHALAIRSETGTTDKTLSVPPEVFSKRKKDDSIHLSKGRWENWETGKFQTADPDPAIRPDLTQVIPELTEDYSVVSLDAEILYRLARALRSRGNTSQKVTLILPGVKDRDTPIAVLAATNAGMVDGESFGLLMPLRTDDTTEEVIARFTKLATDHKQTCLNPTDEDA